MQLPAAYDAVTGGSALGRECAVVLSYSEVGSVGQSATVEHHPGDGREEDFSSVSLIQVHSVKADDRQSTLQLHVVHSVACDALSPGTARFAEEQLLRKVDGAVQIPVCDVDYVCHVVCSVFFIFVRGISDLFSVVNIQS